ncbi:hypothetical protein [Polaromonas sp. YR568]|uniref:hypothetical protein n=1 Tax=Polaromonas sp. YR568 TaxID=1855301 RepID=UPI00398BD0E9
MDNELFKDERTPRGKQIVFAVSRQLETEYLTALSPKEVLQARLHEAVAQSCARLENRSGERH